MFEDWFKAKYEAWREGKYGHDAGQAAFARYLGINYQSVHEYLNGKSEPAYEEVIDKLYAKYGPEVLIALGREPSPRDEIIHLIDRIPESNYPKLMKKIRALLKEFGIEDLEFEVSNNDP